MGVDISGGMLFRISQNGGKELIATLAEVEAAIKAATSAGEQHGKTTNKLTQLLRGEGKERRLQNLAFREGRDLMLMSTMALMSMSGAQEDAETTGKKLTKSLIEGMMVYQTTSFGIKGIATALGKTTGPITEIITLILGAGVAAYEFFAGVNAEAKKATEEGLKQFGDVFGGLSKFGQAGTVKTIDALIAPLKAQIKALESSPVGSMTIHEMRSKRSTLQDQIDTYEKLREKAEDLEKAESARQNVLTAMNRAFDGNYTTIQAINVNLAINKKELETGVDFLTKQVLSAKDFERIQNNILTLETNKARIQQGEQPYTNVQVKIIESTSFALSMVGQRQAQANAELEKYLKLRGQAWEHKPLILKAPYEFGSITGKEQELAALDAQIKETDNLGEQNRLLERRKNLQREINLLNMTDTEKQLYALSMIGNSLNAIQVVLNDFGVSEDSAISKMISGFNTILDIVNAIKATAEAIKTIETVGTMLGLFHSGGIPIPVAHSGLMLGSNYQGNREMLVKMHAGEEIITPYDPRHKKNGGKSASPQVSVSYNVVASDSRSFESMLNSPAHRRALEKAIAKQMRSVN